MGKVSLGFCNAPLVENSWTKVTKRTKRCGLPLGPEKSLYTEGNPQGRECANEHFSMKCKKCNITDFAVTAYPKGEHETFMGVYWCRHCDEVIYSDEGININWGEIEG